MFEVFEPDDRGRYGLYVDDIFEKYLFKKDMTLVEILDGKVYVYSSEDYPDGRYIEIITAGRIDGRHKATMDYLLSFDDTECLLKDETGKTIANFFTDYGD